MSFWDWKTGHRFQSLDTTAQPGSLDAEAGIMSSTYDRTGLRLITGEADKTSKFWDDTQPSFLHICIYPPVSSPKSSLQTFPETMEDAGLSFTGAHALTFLFIAVAPAQSKSGKKTRTPRPRRIRCNGNRCLEGRSFEAASEKFSSSFLLFTHLIRRLVMIGALSQL